ncbi:hypothetical protein BC938DRAFT_473511 [Jimgerdemannia flammicorona]|uniref:Uncharacterized protein n=1 Tax=Jimgerdemannia flammicorona TaxID=994334 RepID=A0A433Q3T8_9FUNG|nr:hypothetical protein BC938DRAFT_473511 [Jimgerdemannia flammicorona]
MEVYVLRTRTQLEKELETVKGELETAGTQLQIVKDELQILKNELDKTRAENELLKAANPLCKHIRAAWTQTNPHEQRSLPVIDESLTLKQHITNFIAIQASLSEDAFTKAVEHYLLHLTWMQLKRLYKDKEIELKRLLIKELNFGGTVRTQRVMFNNLVAVCQRYYEIFQLLGPKYVNWSGPFNIVKMTYSEGYRDTMDVMRRELAKEGEMPSVVIIENPEVDELMDD